MHIHHLSDNLYKCKNVFIFLAEAQENHIIDFLSDEFSDISMDGLNFDVSFFDEETLSLINETYTENFSGRIALEV